MRNKIEKYGLRATVDSAGTSDYHEGENPDKRSVANGLKNKVDISTLVSRPFTVKDFDNFDRIYVMDSENLRNVLALARNGEDAKKVKLILNEVEPGSNRHVPDPYFGGEEGFQRVFHLLDEACEAIAKQLKK